MGDLWWGSAELRKEIIKRGARKLLNGSVVNEAPVEVKWEFESKCPDKWVHIDCEDGNIYVTKDGDGWKEATHDQLKSAAKAIRREIKNTTYICEGAKKCKEDCQHREGHHSHHTCNILCDEKKGVHGSRCRRK